METRDIYAYAFTVYYSLRDKATPFARLSVVVSSFLLNPQASFEKYDLASIIQRTANPLLRSQSSDFQIANQVFVLEQRKIQHFDLCDSSLAGICSKV